MSSEQKVPYFSFALIRNVFLIRKAHRWPAMGPRALYIALCVMFCGLMATGCGHHVRLNPGAAVPIDITSHRYINAVACEAGHCSGNVRGLYSSGEWVLINNRATPRQQIATILHEFGHHVTYLFPPAAPFIGQALRDFNGRGFDTGADQHEEWAEQ